MPLLLLSPVFPAGGAIPPAFTCDGSDISPPLEWSGTPTGTQSFVIIVEDPDAPGGAFNHWVAWDLGAGNSGLPGGYRAGQTEPFHQGTNGFGKLGYSGPCPPPGSGPHHYRFIVLALNRKPLMPSPPADAAAVLSAAKPYVIGRAELTGTYSR